MMSSDDKMNCVLCNESFNDKETLQTHFRMHGDPVQHHSLRKKKSPSEMEDEKTTELITCDVCPEVFVTISKAITHKHKMHPNLDSKYFCPVCGKLFTMKHLFVKHTRGHAPCESNDSFHCNMCDVDFVLPAAMLYHNKFYHRLDKEDSSIGYSKKYIMVNKELLQLYYCPFCGEENVNKVNLQKHLADDHSQEESNFSEILRCPLCQAIFYHLDAYDAHLAYHTVDDLYVGNEKTDSTITEFTLESVPPDLEKVERVGASNDSDGNYIGVDTFLQLAMDSPMEEANDLDTYAPDKVKHHKKHKKHKKSKKSAITLDEFLNMNQDVFGEDLNFQGIEEVPSRVVTNQLRGKKIKPKLTKKLGANAANLEKLKLQGIVVKKKAPKQTSIIMKNPIKILNQNSQSKAQNETQTPSSTAMPNPSLQKLLSQSNSQVQIKKTSQIQDSEKVKLNVTNLGNITIKPAVQKKDGTQENAFRPVSKQANVNEEVLNNDKDSKEILQSNSGNNTTKEFSKAQTSSVLPQLSNRNLTVKSLNSANKINAIDEPVFEDNSDADSDFDDWDDEMEKGAVSNSKSNDILKNFNNSQVTIKASNTAVPIMAKKPMQTGNSNQMQYAKIKKADIEEKFHSQNKERLSKNVSDQNKIVKQNFNIQIKNNEKELEMLSDFEDFVENSYDSDNFESEDLQEVKMKEPAYQHNNFNTNIKILNPELTVKSINITNTKLNDTPVVPNKTTARNVLKVQEHIDNIDDDFCTDDDIDKQPIGSKCQMPNSDIFKNNSQITMKSLNKTRKLNTDVNIKQVNQSFKKVVATNKEDSIDGYNILNNKMISIKRLKCEQSIQEEMSPTEDLSSGEFSDREFDWDDGPEISEQVDKKEELLKKLNPNLSVKSINRDTSKQRNFVANKDVNIQRNKSNSCNQVPAKITQIPSNTNQRNSNTPNKPIASINPIPKKANPLNQLKNVVKESKSVNKEQERISQEVTVKTIQTKTVVQEITTTVTKTVRTLNQEVNVGTNVAKLPAVEQRALPAPSPGSGGQQKVVRRTMEPIGVAGSSKATQGPPPQKTHMKIAPSKTPLHGPTNRETHGSVGGGSNLMNRKIRAAAPVARQNMYAGTPVKMAPQTVISNRAVRPSASQQSFYMQTVQSREERFSSNVTSKFNSTSKAVNSTTVSQMRSEMSNTLTQQLNKLSNTGLKIVKTNTNRQVEKQTGRIEQTQKRLALDTIEKLQKQGLLVKKARVDDVRSESEDEYGDVDYQSMDEDNG